MQLITSGKWWLLCCAMMVALSTAPVRGDHFRLAMPSDDDQYIIDLFALALEAEGGDHTFEVVRRVILAQDRALRALADNKARYEVHYSGYAPARERDFAMVRFPITRGMLGHRLLAICAADKDMLAGVDSAEKLAAFRLGSGMDWPDTTILRAAGLTVTTGSDSNLWPMLARKRFDAFPRGINEIQAEIKSEGQGKLDKQLMIDTHVMLVYRYDHFFYLSKANAHKARIIERGLIKAFESGKLDAFLDGVPALQATMAELKAHPRHVIHIDNPLLGPEIKKLPAAYWRTYP